jgi:hypothetical protein
MDYEIKDRIEWKGITGEIVHTTRLFYDVKVLNDDSPYHDKGQVTRIYKKWID